MDNLHYRPPHYSTFADGVSLLGVGASLFHFARAWATLPLTARIPMQFNLWGQPTWTAARGGFPVYPALCIGVPLLLRSTYNSLFLSFFLLLSFFHSYLLFI